MARITYIPNRVIDSNGIADGASVYVYLASTTTPVTIYADEALTTPLSNPVVVPAGSAVPPIYYGTDLSVRVRVVAVDGTVVSDDNPYLPLGQGIPGRDADELSRSAYFTAADGETVFDLGALYQAGILYVFRNSGLLPPSEYSAPGGDVTTVTLSTPAEAGDQIAIIYLLPPNSIARRVNVLEFGAVGDGVTDDRPAFVRAFSYLKSLGGGALVLPPVQVCYVLSEPLVWSAEAPILIEGDRLGSARPYSYEGQTAIKYTGDQGTTAITIETDGASEGFPGVTAGIRNLLLFREDIEDQADDGSGIVFRGCHRVEVDDVGLWGFANGVETNDNPSGAGATSVRCNATVLRRVEVRQAARHRFRIRGSAETHMEYCVSEADPVANYTSDLYCGPGSNGGRCDGIKVHSCNFIGGTDVVADMPDYNVQLDGTLWAVFTGCAFERARYAGLQVSNASGDAYDLSVNGGQWWGVYTYGCEFNGQGNICIDVFRSRFAFRDTVMHQMSMQGDDPYTATHAPVRVRAGSGAEIPALGGTISGGMIHFSGPTGIDIDNAASITVDGGIYFVDLNDAGNPSVTLGDYAANCAVMFNNGDGSAGDVIDEGAFNTVLNNAVGYVYNQGISHQSLYVNSTLDGSGNATVAHGVTNFTDYALEVSANYLSAGAGSARHPLTVNYWDNANVSVSGGAPAASKACRVYFTFKRNGVL
jgi:hypothetical protein